MFCPPASRLQGVWRGFFAAAIAILAVFFIVPTTHAQILNEYLADPDGDANGDGTFDNSQDEFIEIYNDTGSPLDLTDWTVSDAAASRHTFPSGTTVAAGCSLVLFGGGTPTGSFGGSVVQTASSGLLGFSTNDSVILRDAASAIVISHSYTGANVNQSLTLDPDITGGSYVEHTTATGSGGVPYSPGTRIDGSSFSGCGGGATPTATITPGGPTLTPTLTPTATSTPTITQTPTITPTPGAFGNAKINEFVANHTGTDTNEFIEIYGDPSTNYSALTIVTIEGDVQTNPTDPGIVDASFPVGTTDGNGFWVSNYSNNVLGNGTMTLLLVENWVGTVGMDLDSNDDGVVDSPPWTSIVDAVAVYDQDAGDQTYGGATQLTEFFDGVSFLPGGASRIPDGQDTNSDSDWKRNDFDGEGLPGFSGTVDPGEAENTPGSMNMFNNSPTPTPTSGPVSTDARISEFVINHTGNDNQGLEFVEIFGDAENSYSGLRIVSVAGDAGRQGTIDAIIVPGTTDINGFWASSTGNDVFQDGTQTLFLVDGFFGTLSQDLDTNNDGVLDIEPWTNVLDSVGSSSGLAGEFVYSSTVLLPSSRGGNDAVGGASRIPYYQDSDTANDWFINDFDGENLGGLPGSLVAGEAYNTPGEVNRVLPEDYYTGVDTSSDTGLRNSLHNIIRGHVKYPYSDSLTDTWDILEEADEDPSNSSNIISVYKNASIAKFGGGNGPYNREHSWPKSYGFPDNNSDTSAYTDCHHLMLSDPTYNSDRSNQPFDDCNAGCTERPTDVNNGVGGGVGVYPGNSNWYDGNFFEVWDHRKGDIARAQLYMDVRYAGGVHPAKGWSEPDLELTDNDGLIQTTGTNTTGKAYMGLLSTLLTWHQADPVDAEELARNEVVYRYQGNRNPFVDHPEWVECVFSGVCSGPTPTPTQSTLTPTPTGSMPPSPTATGSMPPSPTATGSMPPSPSPTMGGATPTTTPTFNGTPSATPTTSSTPTVTPTVVPIDGVQAANASVVNGASVAATVGLDAGDYCILVVENGTWTIGNSYSGNAVADSNYSSSGQTQAGVQVWANADEGEYDILVLSGVCGSRGGSMIVAADDASSEPGFVVVPNTVPVSAGWLVLLLPLLVLSRLRWSSSEEQTLSSHC